MSNSKLHAALYDNVLTEQEGDFCARPKSTGTMYNVDVAKEIVKGRTEYRQETIENILRMADEVKIKSIAEGKTVIDGVGQYSVLIRGVFDGPSAPFDRTKHQLMTAYNASKMLREQLLETEVITETALPGGPIINVVFDPTHPQTRDQLPFRGMVLIEGARLTLRGDDPSVGITFTPMEPGSEDKPVFIKPQQCAPNQPSKLQFSLPAEIAVGTWQVKVTTQYSSSSTTTKEPRTYEYSNLVSVF